MIEKHIENALLVYPGFEKSSIPMLWKHFTRPLSYSTILVIILQKKSIQSFDGILNYLPDKVKLLLEKNLK